MISTCRLNIVKVISMINYNQIQSATYIQLLSTNNGINTFLYWVISSNWRFQTHRKVINYINGEAFLFNVICVENEFYGNTLNYFLSYQDSYS